MSLSRLPSECGRRSDIATRRGGEQPLRFRIVSDSTSTTTLFTEALVRSDQQKNKVPGSLPASSFIAPADSSATIRAITSPVGATQQVWRTSRTAISSIGF